MSDLEKNDKQKRKRDEVVEFSTLKEYVDTLLDKGCIGPISLLLFFDELDEKIPFVDVFWDVFGFLEGHLDDWEEDVDWEDVGKYVKQIREHLESVQGISENHQKALLGAFRAYQHYLEELHDIRIRQEHDARERMEKKMRKVVEKIEELD